MDLRNCRDLTIENLTLRDFGQDDLNDTASPAVTFTVDGAATDPTTITLTVIPPDKNTATYTYAGGSVTKSSTGVYTKDITLDQRGVWYLRFTGTGACQASAEGTLRVRA